MANENKLELTYEEVIIHLSKGDTLRAFYKNDLHSLALYTPREFSWCGMGALEPVILSEAELPAIVKRDFWGIDPADSEYWLGVIRPEEALEFLKTKIGLISVNGKSTLRINRKKGTVICEQYMPKEKGKGLLRETKQLLRNVDDEQFHQIVTNNCWRIDFMSLPLLA